MSRRDPDKARAVSIAVGPSRRADRDELAYWQSVTARQAWIEWQLATDPTERMIAQETFVAACERAR